jgi:hypothetical protein
MVKHKQRTPVRPVHVFLSVFLSVVSFYQDCAAICWWSHELCVLSRNNNMRRAD